MKPAAYPMRAAMDPSPPEAPEERGALQVRTVWISDLHLGTPGCQAQALLEFLRQVECEQLFLVGDIIDGWQLRRSWYWPQAHNDVVQKLLRKARKGCRVIFIPGNHDEFARRYLDHSFGGIEVAEDWLHVTADGRRLWITHGDLFDGVVQCARWLALLGDQAYEFTLKLNRWLNSARARLGLPYWSLSKYLKLKVKRAVSYVSDFETALAREAKKRGADGVVCGHIHHAELREIEGVLYANDGDWVESLTALVEHADGRLEILDWSALAQTPQQRAAAANKTSSSVTELSPSLHRIIR
ncbi:UDP-2,3-diacylglucosamine diphosphatase [Roseateles sp. DAIF2]|nr:UDP-2,3-diacylglucosamine diphosphatase [Roseateles sp. DAIF2]